MSNEEVSMMLYNKIPQEQKDRVFGGECDINSEFMGFVDVYKKLSEIIPKNFTIVDFGCGYNPQSFLFELHKRYIAVDPHKSEVFMSKNCEYYNMTAGEFVRSMVYDGLDLDETFCICSFVPNWYNESPREKARLYFKNIFTYYPHVQESSPSL